MGLGGEGCCGKPRSGTVLGYYRGAMHLADPIFIFILALVLLGPKKTGELGQQLGKLMGEFRKASNDFKYQFSEEMRVAEQQELVQKQEAEKAVLPATASAENTILPPSAPVEAVPYAVSATTGQEQPVEDHPLLRVDVIPPMDGSPADQSSNPAVTPSANGNGHGSDPAREHEEAQSHRG